MATAHAQISRAAEFLGRLATAAAGLQIGVTELALRAEVFGDAMAEFARVKTGDDFDFLAVAVRQRGGRTPTGQRRNQFLELSTQARSKDIVVTEHRLGRGHWQDDVDNARGGGAVVGELARVLAVLSPDGSGAGISECLGTGGAVPRWLIHTGQPLTDPTVAKESSRRIDEAAVLCGITERQRRFIAKMHVPLSRGRVPVVSAAATADGLSRELRISYQDVPFETIVRILRGVYPDGEHPSKLGIFAGAFDVDHAASCIFVLGDREPLHVEFAIEVRG